MAQDLNVTHRLSSIFMSREVTKSRPVTPDGPSPVLMQPTVSCTSINLPLFHTLLFFDWRTNRFARPVALLSVYCSDAVCTILLFLLLTPMYRYCRRGSRRGRLLRSRRIPAPCFGHFYHFWRRYSLWALIFLCIVGLGVGAVYIGDVVVSQTLLLVQVYESPFWTVFSYFA